MAKRILVAMDDSENSFRAAKIVAETFAPDHDVTLFSVYLDAEQLFESKGSQVSPYFLSYKMLLDSMEEKRKESLTTAQEKAKGILLEAGFPEKRITTKVESMKKGVARDIIEEALTGYDVVVMGRRGLSSLSEFVLGSVSQKVLHAIKDSTLVIVN